jgi:hypothetical protein
MTMVGVYLLSEFGCRVGPESHDSSGWVYSSIGPVPVLFSSWFSTVRGKSKYQSWDRTIIGFTALFGPVPVLSYETLNVDVL